MTWFLQQVGKHLLVEIVVAALLAVLTRLAGRKRPVC